MSHALAINNVIAGNLDLPVMLPIFPFEPKNSGMKKCVGEISRNGETLLEFSYKLNKGDLEAVNLKGAKNDPAALTTAMTDTLEAFRSGKISVDEYKREMQLINDILEAVKNMEQAENAELETSMKKQKVGKR